MECRWTGATHTYVPRAGHNLTLRVVFPDAILQIITEDVLHLSFIALGDVTSHYASSTSLLRSTDCTYQRVGAFEWPSQFSKRQPLIQPTMLEHENENLLIIAVRNAYCDLDLCNRLLIYSV